MRRFHELSPRVSLGVALSSHRCWWLASGSFARRCRSLHTLDWSSSWAKRAGKEIQRRNVNLHTQKNIYFTTVGVSRLHFNRCCGWVFLLVAWKQSKSSCQIHLIQTITYVSFNETWAHLNSCTISSVLLAEFWSNLNPFRWICTLLAASRLFKRCSIRGGLLETDGGCISAKPIRFANFSQSHKY